MPPTSTARGRPSVAVTNFDNEMVGLYRPASARACTTMSRCAPDWEPPSRNTLGFGCVFADLDLDGHLDLVVANGHIDETVRQISGNVGYAQPPHLFLNQGNGTFRDRGRRGRQRLRRSRASGAGWRTATSTTTAISICW